MPDTQIPPASRAEAEQELARLRVEMEALSRNFYSVILGGLGISFLAGAIGEPDSRLILGVCATLAFGGAGAGWGGLIRFPYPQRWGPPIPERIAFLEGFLAGEPGRPAT